MPASRAARQARGRGAQATGADVRGFGAGVIWGGALGMFGLGLASLMSPLPGAGDAGGLPLPGVAAVTAQISEHARAASSLAGLALGVAYTIRAVGDVTGS